LGGCRRNRASTRTSGRVERCAGPRHRNPWDPNPLQLTDVFGRCCRTRRRRPGVRHLGSHRDAQREAARAPPCRRNRLLLVPRTGLCLDEHVVVRAVARGRPPVFPWSVGFCRGNNRSRCASRPVARMAQIPRQWNGFVLHSPAHGILRRQWPELAALAKPTIADPLGCAEHRGSPHSHPRPVATSTYGATAPSKIVRIWRWSAQSSDAPIAPAHS